MKGGGVLTPRYIIKRYPEMHEMHSDMQANKGSPFH